MALSPLPHALRAGPHRSFPQQVRAEEAGVSIAEIVIAATLIAATISAAAILTGVSSRSLTISAGRGNEQNRIDTDLSAIRDLAETYTWCSGAGSFSSCTTGVAARTENYYFPPPGSSVAIANFSTACSTTGSDTLNTALVTAISARPALPGITRTVANDDIATHRLRISYAGSSANRVVLLVPTVAAWCP